MTAEAYLDLWFTARLVSLACFLAYIPLIIIGDGETQSGGSKHLMTKGG